MKSGFRFAFGFALAFLVAALVSAQAASAEKKEVSKAPAHKAAGSHLMPPQDLKWTDVKEVKGAQQAVVWGNPEKGAYAAFDKWPGGTDVGAHTHSNDIKATVISGTMVIKLGDGPEKELPAGSWIHTGPNDVHSSKCKAGADCVFYLTQPGKFDFKPVEKK
jgi:quercetin dioxygenase-like cupin family protein